MSGDLGPGQARESVAIAGKRRPQTAKLTARLVVGRARAASLVLWTAFARGRLGAPTGCAQRCRFWAESRIPCCIARCRHRRRHGTLLSGHGHRDISTAIQALPATTQGTSSKSNSEPPPHHAVTRRDADAGILLLRPSSRPYLPNSIVSCSLRPHRSVCVCPPAGVVIGLP